METPPMELPPPTKSAEQDFVTDTVKQGEQFVHGAICAALEAGRPLLAARLIPFLPGDLAVDPALDKARRAVQFHILPAQKKQEWGVYDQCLADRIQNHRFQRAKTRHRTLLKDKTAIIKPTRKPRRR